MANKKRIAVVLFNLGGPDGPEAVQPFLFNLFRDNAILAVSAPIRYPLAWLISSLRAKSARKEYAKMGGGSPLLPETKKQARALGTLLSQSASEEWRVFIAMRYWRPFVAETAREVAAWAPDETVLLPLYPQFSTTTTGSSLTAWTKAEGEGARTVCCYPVQDGLVAAHAEAISETWEAAGRPQNVRLIFSAHGLPQKTVDAGDPYQAQVEMTAAAVAARLPGLADWTLAYQSRVGPLKWIGPPIKEAIEIAAEDGKGVLISPIAFVSEHIETLVELDEEYRELAEGLRITTYLRAPALGTRPAYIGALASLARGALEGPRGLKPPCGERLCRAKHGVCPMGDRR